MLLAERQHADNIRSRLEEAARHLCDACDAKRRAAKVHLAAMDRYNVADEDALEWARSYGKAMRLESETITITTTVGSMVITYDAGGNPCVLPIPEDEA